MVHDTNGGNAQLKGSKAFPLTGGGHSCNIGGSKKCFFNKKKIKVYRMMESMDGIAENL